MKKTIFIVLALCLSVSAQTHYGGGAGQTVWYGVADAPPPPPPAPGENAWCNPGTGAEKSEGTPTWPATVGPASTDNRCFHTALSSTPTGTHPDLSPGNTFVPATAATYASVLASVGGGAAVTLAGNTGGSLHLNCGDTIQLAAGSTYVGPFNYPNITCDGGHWIFTVSSGITNASFPLEGVQATPCVSGIANDGTHGRSLPGYPDYVCVTPTVLTAKIQSGTGGPGQPAIAFTGATSTTGANHYRFIGIEIVKNPASNVSCFVLLTPDHATLGANHIIFDRSPIHGVTWTTSSTNADTVQCAINADGSQWVAEINSWNYDTYCETSCVDSQAFNFGANINQDGPFKLWNNLMASAGETYIGGGGGIGAGMPNTRGFEARGNWFFKPLTWMVPIEYCGIYSNVIPKNLGEFKNMTFAFVEGNIYENSWQGCQSDQIGYATLFNPSSQNNHVGMNVNFNGTNVVTISGSGNFTQIGTLATNVPNDPTYCPPSGCVLEIADSTRTSDNGVHYFFCNGANGCNQTGIANLKCARGSNVNNACASDSDCPGSTLVGRCSPTTTARLSSTVATGSAVAVNACVPGDCPTCRNQHIVFRLNEIYNVTNGFEVNAGLSSHCNDEAAGMSDVYVGDVKMHGVSAEMSNGSQAYSSSEGFSVSSSNENNVLHNIEISHVDVMITDASSGSASGLGDQVDHTNRKYFAGLNIHDNVSPQAWAVNRSKGSIVTQGVLGKPGLANVYQTDACRAYYPTQAPTGFVVAGNLSAFTFSPARASYFVTVNGSYKALASTPAPTSTSFTLSSPAVVGDQITVRDLNDCPYNFAGNILGGTLLPADPLPGMGRPNDPYPNPNSCGNGPFLPADSCILGGANFAALFANFNGGRNGDFTITNPTYQNAATDADVRPATGKNAGVDLVTLAATTAGIRGGVSVCGVSTPGTVFYPCLSITTSALTSGVAGTPYQFPLVASAGASLYKGWWLETDTSKCGGPCGTLPPGIVIGRSGNVGGPFLILSASIKNNRAKIALKQTIVAPVSPAIGWTTGQTVQLAGFCVDGAGSAAWSSGTTYAKDAQVTYSGAVYTSLAGSNTNHQPDTSPTWWAAVCPGVQASDGAFNGTWIVAASNADCTNSSSVVCLTLTHADIASHAPSTAKTNNPTSTFAPTTAGSYSWWVGARDGAFQIARAQVTLVVNGTLGILAPARAMDWTQAGVVGGIPTGSWSRCTTGTGTSILASSSTAAQINTAISGCDANHYVELASGTFSLTSGVLFNSKNSTALRGQGANSTLLVFSGSIACQGFFPVVCFQSSDQNYSGGPTNTANWTAGYAQGATTISLSSIANLKVGNPLTLDQTDDVCGTITGGVCAGDNSAVFICYTPISQCSTNGDNGGAPRAGRSQQQIVTVASCDGNSTVGHACASGASITISPGLYMPNWSSGKTPQAWWASNPISTVGLENLSINAGTSTALVGVGFFNCKDCWLRGVRTVGPFQRSAVQLLQANHVTIQDNYFFRSNDDPANNYGVEPFPGSDVLVQNNIFEQIQAPYPANGSCSGCVFAYNFDVNNIFNNATPPTFLAQSAYAHAVGDDHILYEGNIGAGFNSDNFHGTHHLQTLFRNYWNGYQKNEGQFNQNGQGTRPVILGAYSRFYNVIGNVLGNCALQTVYENAAGNAHAGSAIFDIGFGNAIPNDANTVTTLFRWGNYDCITNTNRFVNAEVPSGLSGTQAPFANPVPATQTLPASFYLISKPAWWPSGKTWPPIGPDVTGGNVKYCTGGAQSGTYVLTSGQCPGGTATTLAGGRIVSTPAMDCYLNTMSGPPDGQGAVLAFDRVACGY